MMIGTPVYDGVDLLDVTSPHKMLHWMSQSQIDVVIRPIAEQAGPIKTATGSAFSPAAALPTPASSTCCGCLAAIRPRWRS